MQLQRSHVSEHTGKGRVVEMEGAKVEGELGEKKGGRGKEKGSGNKKGQEQWKIWQK